jgi:1-acyl-sn-glycerol-3-phosphate acyltransferase
MEAPIDIHAFDDIRPYNDAELKLALARLVEEDVLYKMMRWVYPGLSKMSIRKMFLSIQTVQQFQEEISAPAVKVITQMTTSGLSFSNLESLEKNKGYLFISNHRDIVLDSALLNISLFEHGLNSTEIAIGDNLLKTQAVRDLVRANKNIIVNRDINAKEVYYYSLRLSNYIRHSITQNHTGVWIAQREGRSKNGDDRTSTGLLKMFAMSSVKSVEDALAALNLLPMCVSYEYDPCDLLKTHELLHHKIFGHYTKQPLEDFHSMLTGITGHKGRVHVSVGHPLNEALEVIRNISNKNEKFRAIGEAIDRQMHAIYKLWPTNFIAYDLLHDSKDYRNEYSNIQKIAFQNYVRGRVWKLTLGRKKTGLPKENLYKMAREIMLEMYANPVINHAKMNASSSLVDANDVA